MVTVDTVVIGAGQAGLAASRCLTQRGVDHAVLERGRIGERWRSERWDSLRLLTPNWLNSLPGRPYGGPDLHGYMAANDFVEYLDDYAHATNAPVHGDSAVQRLTHRGDTGFEVVTTDDTWRAASVIVATGWCDQPAIPPMARHLDATITQLSPADYRHPGSVPPGGVLVVGASATGVQLAAELRRSGRRVVLAVGRHTRVPRRYRGMDIYWWLHVLGSLDRGIDELPDADAARHEPSLQLAGRTDRPVDLASLSTAGVTLAGRLTGAVGHHVRFAGDLHRSVATADTRMRRVLTAIDDHIDANGLAGEVLDPELPPLVPLGDARTELDLRRCGITSVIWATGHRRTYPWLHVPVLDPDGAIRHDHGITPVPGLYVLGQRFQRTRSSHVIAGVGRDAAFVTDHLVDRLAATPHH